jgi:hypothetical protein
MELHEVEVIIEKNGEVRIEVRGLKGGGCLAATRELEQSLGGIIAHREMTPEAAESSGENNPNQQWQSQG